MSKNVLIVQPLIPAYRISLFLKLAHSYGKITILHFGKAKVFHDERILEYIGTYNSVGSLKIVKDLNKTVRKYDIIITAFDPHWINLFFLAISINKERKKIVYWGHGFGKNSVINKIRVQLVKRSHALITYNQ